MDISAVLNASGDVLKDMGLSTAGDRLSLRGFCSTAQEKQHKEEKESKRRRLLEAFLSSKKDRSTKLTTASGNQQQKKKLEKEKKSLNEYKLDGNTSERRLKTMFLYLCLREVAVGMQPCCYQVTEQTL